MKKLLAVFIASVTLVGCKVDIGAEANYVDIQSLEHKLITGNAYFEVSSCKNFEDSRLESDSLIRLKKAVPEVFSNAEYVECFEKRMDSYAHYKIPVGVGNFDDGKDIKEVNAELYIFSNEKIRTGVMMSEALINKIKAKEKESMSNLSFNINLKINGDGTPVKGYVLSSYVQSEKNTASPEVARKLSWKGNKPLVFTLSNTSVDSVMAYGAVPVIVSPNYFVTEW